MYVLFWQLQLILMAVSVKPAEFLMFLICKIWRRKMVVDNRKDVRRQSSLFFSKFNISIDKNLPYIIYCCVKCCYHSTFIRIIKEYHFVLFFVGWQMTHAECMRGIFQIVVVNSIPIPSLPPTFMNGSTRIEETFNYKIK